MSGHSKWHNIAQKKGANDAKKAKIFTKIGREMAVAIKEGGVDPNHNSHLRDCIAKAKANNVPNDNIKRMIDKYSKNADNVQYETIIYEGYGRSGLAIIVEAMTDNRNRTASDVRHYFDKYGAGLGAAGCVSWQFERKGVLVINAENLEEDTVMMDALESGALDFSAEGDVFEIYTTQEDFSTVREALEEKGYEFLEAEVQMLPENYITLESEEDKIATRKLLDVLEDNDDVQKIFHNWENEE